VDFDMERFQSDALKVNPKLKIMTLSCTTGEGFDDWLNWIEDRKQIARVK